MMASVTKAALIAFEDRVREAFLRAEIRSPIHLSGGNEDQLVRLFDGIRPQDWVFSTWRSHYHALLKGIDPEALFAQIMAGRSMFVSSREYRFLSSAIVGGCLPIAVGVAMGIKRSGGDERVWVFAGDMAAETGAFHEAVKYAGGHGLPMRFVVEDNGLSTNTPTRQVWGESGEHASVYRYHYERVWPHTGAGQWVVFP